MADRQLPASLTGHSAHVSQTEDDEPYKKFKAAQERQLPEQPVQSGKRTETRNSFLRLVKRERERKTFFDHIPSKFSAGVTSLP